MTAFSFYIPGTNLNTLQDISQRLRISCAELDETFLSEDPQRLYTARYESGLRYVALRLNEPADRYARADLIRIGRWCETNYVEAVIFMNPGVSEERADCAARTLSCFRIKTAFENANGSFLNTVVDMDRFFRGRRDAFLSFNPREMVKQRVHPFLSALNGQTYRRQLFMVRAEDRRFNGDTVLPVNGDAELMEICSSAAAFGLDTWISVSPYAGYPADEIKSAMCAALCKI